MTALEQGFDVHLPSTPTSADGGLLISAGSVLPDPVRSPLMGPARCVDGVMCRPFVLTWDPARSPVEGTAGLHLTSWVDLRPGGPAPIALRPDRGGGSQSLGVILPEDGMWSYRFVLGREPRADGSGGESGGDDPPTLLPDPLNPHRIDHPSLGPSSVLLGPRAATHPAWDLLAPAIVSREEHLLQLPDRRVRLLRDPRDPPGAAGAAALLVVFDEAAWTRMGLVDALRRFAPVVHVALVDTLDAPRRARDLTNLQRSQVLLAGVIDVAGACLRRPFGPADVIVAGQSHGGLAASLLATCRPDLVGSAIIQSASLWHRRGMAADDPRTEPGELVAYLRSRAGALGMTGLCGRARPGRLVAQVGTDERDQGVHTRAFRDAARAAGMLVDYREYRGGHDYAWWAHGLLRGLEMLLA